jgi:hypothetical protein
MIHHSIRMLPITRISNKHGKASSKFRLIQHSEGRRKSSDQHLISGRDDSDGDATSGYINRPAFKRRRIADALIVTGTGSAKSMMCADHSKLMQISSSSN